MINNKVLEEIRNGNIDVAKGMDDTSIIRELTEDDLTQMVLNLVPNFRILYSPTLAVIFAQANISERVMEAMIKKAPILLTDKSVNPKMTPRIKQILLDDFCDNTWKYKKHKEQCGAIWHIMDMDDSMWIKAIEALRSPGAADFHHELYQILRYEEMCIPDAVAEYAVEQYH